MSKPKPSSGGNRKNLIIILSAIAALLIVGLVIFFATRNTGGNEGNRIPDKEPASTKAEATTGGGGSGKTTKATEAKTTATEKKTTEKETTTEEPAVTSIDGKVSLKTLGKKIYAYSWDDDFQKKLNVVLDNHPELKDYVEYINLGCSSADSLYAIDNAFGSDKYPSLIPADAGIAKYWINDDSKTLDLYSVGLTSDLMSNSYQYAIDFSTYKGQLKAVTWQNCAGSVFYNRAIAKDVFGTDDPAVIQEKLKDWNAFFDTAAELKKKGYKIVSGFDEVYYALANSRNTAWFSVTSDNNLKFAPDTSIEQYLQYAKILSDGGYTNGSNMWDGNWFSSMQEGNKVFCYFGCTWMTGVFSGNGAPNGAWGTVIGPTCYYWGGTYVSVGKDTPNPGLCAFILYELTCDPDIAVQITNQTGDAVNNIEANERLANGELSSDSFQLNFFGGQNPYAVWADSSKRLRLEYSTFYDRYYEDYIKDAAIKYVDGSYGTVDQAIAGIRQAGKKELGIP